MLQQVVGMVSMNKRHTESVKHDSPPRGIENFNSQGQKDPKQLYYV